MDAHNDPEDYALEEEILDDAEEDIRRLKELGTELYALLSRLEDTRLTTEKIRNQVEHLGDAATDEDFEFMARAADIEDDYLRTLAELQELITAEEKNEVEPTEDESEDRDDTDNQGKKKNETTESDEKWQISDTVVQQLLAAAQEDALDAEALVQVCKQKRGRDVPNRLIQALKRATQGVQPIKANDWLEFIGPDDLGSMDAIIRQQVDVHNSMANGEASNMDALCSLHRALKTIPTAEKVAGWLTSITAKLSVLIWARRWYTHSTHDNDFASKAYRTYGLRASKNPEKFHAHILASTKSERKLVQGRLAFLKVYSNFGAWVILDPTWDVNMFMGKNKVKAEQLVEKAVASLVEALYTIGGSTQSQAQLSAAMKLVNNQLWELRLCSSLIPLQEN
ncbi:hypothetical protein R3P38DRAFT_3144186 [Favolaschia claudopus]|uniref:Uncharacterized protein n=1 Tax=Favolaschia claudopus TaxID=2862362 RepID=A0AAV9Z3P0_9AGAR